MTGMIELADKEMMSILHMCMKLDERLSTLKRHERYLKKNTLIQSPEIKNHVWMKNKLDGIKSILNTVKKISELEDIAV